MAEKDDLLTAAMKFLWETDTRAGPRWRAWLISVCRLLYAVVRDIVSGRITLHAMSLVYTTLLSLVPLLAISFSVLKGFGAHNQIEPILLNLLAPLGEQGIEITAKVIEFVDNMKVGVLGAVGLGVLVYTVVSMVQKIEGAFNETWHITRHRPLVRRFTDYLSAILVGPVLIFAAFGLSASLTSTSVVDWLTTIPPFGLLLETAGRIAPYVMVVVAFTFLYVFLPHTKVQLRSAAIGGVVAGVLWVTGGWAFTTFVASSTQYTAIYSAFATLIIFLIWLYVSWLIMLVGASIAFYDQHPEYLSAGTDPVRLSNQAKEKLALVIMQAIGKRFETGDAPWTIDALSGEFEIAGELVEEVVEALHAENLLTQTSDDPAGYVPARSLETTGLKEVLDAVRTANESDGLPLRRLPSDPAVDRVLGSVEQALATALKSETLKDLIASERPVSFPER